MRLQKGTSAQKTSNVNRNIILKYVLSMTTPKNADEIARDLFMNVSTVKSHIRRLVFRDKISTAKLIKNGSHLRIYGSIHIIDRFKKEGNNVIFLEKNETMRKPKEGIEYVNDDSEDENTGITKMMKWIIYYALKDLHSKQHKKKKEALEWLMSDDISYITSCACICEYLGIDQQSLIKM